MRLIDKIKMTKYDISRLKKMNENDQIFIDNTFQRRYVWEEKHKIALIETILLGFDIPPIYMWQQEPDPITGEIKYSIVDGQQRIGAILSYINNEFSLKKRALLDAENRSWDNRKFSELSLEDKNNIWTYQLNIEEIDRSVSKRDIIDIFYRLNSTNKVLNPQELRNAKFDGKFIEASIELSDYEFWKDNNVFSVNEIRRMKDVEFASQLLIFLRKGLKAPLNQKTINDMYDLYNEEYLERREDYALSIKILDKIQNVIKYMDDNFRKDLIKITHIYTLFVIFYAIGLYHIQDDTRLYDRLKDFYLQYFNNNFENPHIFDYYNSSNDAVNSTKNRETRFNCVMDYIKEDKMILSDINN